MKQSCSFQNLHVMKQFYSFSYLYVLVLTNQKTFSVRELCAQSTMQNGSFWFCNQSPSCNFFCSKDEDYTYEKAAAVWKSTKQPHPRCEKHGKLAKMHVVKNLLKSNYGRSFFVCSDRSNPCSFWVWGDVQHVAKPKCRHGFPYVIRKVKKEAINKDRLFFCCAQEDSSNYFEWVPKEPYCSAGLPPARNQARCKTQRTIPNRGLYQRSR